MGRNIKNKLDIPVDTDMYTYEVGDADFECMTYGELLFKLPIDKTIVVKNQNGEYDITSLNEYQRDCDNYIATYSSSSKISAYNKLYNDHLDYVNSASKIGGWIYNHTFRNTLKAKMFFATRLTDLLFYMIFDYINENRNVPSIVIEILQDELDFVNIKDKLYFIIPTYTVDGRKLDNVFQYDLTSKFINQINRTEETSIKRLMKLEKVKQNIKETLAME